jgi:hypothetical protein
MREYREETYKHNVIDKKTCDWCGVLIEGKDERGNYVNNNTKDCWDICDFELNWRTGVSYPECGNGEKVEVDLCRDCIVRLFKLLKDEGCKINIEEWDR